MNSLVDQEILNVSPPVRQEVWTKVGPSGSWSQTQQLIFNRTGQNEKITQVLQWDRDISRKKSVGPCKDQIILLY